MRPAEHDQSWDHLLSTDEAAERLRIKPRTVREWVRRGDLAFVRIGQHLFIPASEIERWIAAHTERREPRA